VFNKAFIIFLLFVGIGFSQERQINRQQLRAHETLMELVDKSREQQVRNGLWCCRVATATALTAGCLGFVVNMRSDDHGMCYPGTPFTQYDDAITCTLDYGFKIASFVAVPLCCNACGDQADCC
jgi:hypothetical protein